MSANDQLLLMHGTRMAKPLLQNGFRPGAYLTNSWELAWEYAENSENLVDEDERPTVLVCRVSLSDLEVDQPSISEPCGFGQRAGGDLEEDIEYWQGELNSAMVSLLLVGTAKCSKPILPCQIKLHPRSLMNFDALYQ